MRRLFFPILCISAAIITGCGKQAPRQETAKPFLGKKLTLLATSAHTAVTRDLASGFRAETGAVVEVIEVPYWDLDTSILRDQGSANPRLDVCTSYYFALGDLVKKGALLDLTDFIEAHRAQIAPEDFVPNVYAAYSLFEGRRWALPWDGDVHALYFRKSLLAEHGFAPPRTWEEFSKISSAITAAGRNGASYGTSMIMAPRAIRNIYFLNRLLGCGGEIFDRQGRPAIASAAGVRALTLLVSQARDAMPTPLTTEYETGVSAFVAGRVALSEGWFSLAQDAEDPNHSMIRGDWGVVPLPREPGTGVRTLLGYGFVLSISSKAPNPEVAKSFLLYATRREVQLKGCLTYGGGLDPVRLSILDNPDYDRFTCGAARIEKEILSNSVPWPNGPGATTMADALADAVEAALLGRATPAEALESASRRWEQILTEHP